ncbi:MAG TPA: S9 family peptidase [Sphingobacteriaceae bacterium]|nr:S9 family peptidase [Sphingobacteriaceae bacterium]
MSPICGFYKGYYVEMYYRKKQAIQADIKKYCWLILIIFLAGCDQRELAKQIPVEAFFAGPAKTSFLISPDGTSISYLKPYNGRLNIFIQTLDDKKITQITRETDRSVSYYFWANNNELLYLKDMMGNDRIQLHVANKDGSGSREIFSEDKARIRFINPIRIWDNQLLIALNKRDSSVFDAYKLNINTRKLTLAVRNPGNITNWYADHEGKIRMAVASDGVNETLLFRNSEDESFRSVVTNNFKTSISPIGFGIDNKSRIYALSNQNRDKKALVEFDCNTGKEYKTIFERKDADVIEGEYFNKKKLDYAVYETWRKERYYFDPEIKAIYQELEKQMPNSEIRITDRDLAGKQYLIRISTDKVPGVSYLYTSSNRNLVKLSDANPALKESEMCEMKPISYKSRDGLIIHGYLTYPKGLKPYSLPVVVMPHAGPSSRNSWGFNSEVQFLANRGYAVLQMNYRGSTGYGKEFWAAGFKKWGTDMQNDITDGVKWLIGEGIANPKRIAIYGSSFGGYSALHGMCFQPGLYACGASYSGPINLFNFVKESAPYIRPSLQMYYEMVGIPEKDPDYFRAVSPVFHTDLIRNPILIAQGGKDHRVNVNEINQFVKELKKRKIPITYFLKEDERHYFRIQENRYEFYRKLEKFLADNIGKK